LSFEGDHPALFSLKLKKPLHLFPSQYRYPEIVVASLSIRTPGVNIL